MKTTCGEKVTVHPVQDFVFCPKCRAYLDSEWCCQSCYLDWSDHVDPNLSLQKELDDQGFELADVINERDRMAHQLRTALDGQQRMLLMNMATDRWKFLLLDSLEKIHADNVRVADSATTDAE